MILPTFNIFSILLNILILVLIIVLIRSLWKPVALSKALSRAMQLEHKDPNLPKEVISKCQVFYKQATKAKLGSIIYIPGGIFIASSITPEMFDDRLEEYDIYMIKYPVLFDTKIKTTIEELGGVLDVLLKRDENVHLLSHSAGSFYAMALLSLGRFNKIKTNTCVCGFYGKDTITNTPLKIMANMYMREKILNIQGNVKNWIVTAEDDFIRESSTVFGKKWMLKPTIYAGDHNFLATNDDTFWVDFSEFIKL